VPVITTPLPLAAKLVSDDQIGLVVPWQDPHAVVDAILKLRNDRALRLQLGVNGHRAALRDHDWNRLSTQFVDLMAGFADQPPRPRADRISAPPPAPHFTFSATGRNPREAEAEALS